MWTNTRPRPKTTTPTARLYHKELGFPRNMQLPTDPFRPIYSRHALEAAWDDRYGQVELPAVIHPGVWTLIEAEVEPDGTVNKAVWRTQYNSEYDISVVVFLYERPTVGTLWLNSSRDQHRTLDRRVYARPV